MHVMIGSKTRDHAFVYSGCVKRSGTATNLRALPLVAAMRSIERVVG